HVRLVPEHGYLPADQRVLDRERDHWHRQWGAGRLQCGVVWADCDRDNAGYGVSDRGACQRFQHGGAKYGGGTTARIFVVHPGTDQKPWPEHGVDLPGGGRPDRSVWCRRAGWGGGWWRCVAVLL